MTVKNRPEPEILVALTSAVTHSPRILRIRAGERYRADADEVAVFGRHSFVRDGASDAEVRAANHARRERRPDARYRPAPKVVAEGRRPSIAIARRMFRAGDRIIRAGTRLEASDPIVARYPVEFRFEDGDKHAGRGPLLGPLVGLIRGR